MSNMGDFKLGFILGNEGRDWEFGFVSLFLSYIVSISLIYEQGGSFLLCDHSTDFHSLLETITV